MTSANGIIDRAARNAEKLPLGRIVAAMLGIATAFFCFAMPQRVLDATLGGLGLPVPVGGIGRLLFVLGCAALAAGLGWLAVTVAAGSAAAADGEGEIDLDPPQPRRRAIGPADPREALGAPLPVLLAVRRGDGHPDAPPRRPIFADHDLPVIEDEPARDVPPAAEFRIDAAAPPAELPTSPQPVADESPAAAEAAPPAATEAESQPPSTAEESAIVAPLTPPAAAEPLDLTETLPDRTATPEPVEETPLQAADTPLPVEEAPPAIAETPEPVAEIAPQAVATAEPLEEISSDVETPQPIEETPSAEAAAAVVETPAPIEEPAPTADVAPHSDDEPPPAGERPLAELMARLETGLDRQSGDLPPPPADTVTPLHDATPAPDDALRNALEALQRLAERQR